MLSSLLLPLRLPIFIATRLQVEVNSLLFQRHDPAVERCQCLLYQRLWPLQILEELLLCPPATPMDMLLTQTLYANAATMLLAARCSLLTHHAACQPARRRCRSQKSLAAQMLAGAAAAVSHCRTSAASGVGRRCLKI